MKVLSRIYRTTASNKYDYIQDQGQAEVILAPAIDFKFRCRIRLVRTRQSRK